MKISNMRYGRKRSAPKYHCAFCYKLLFKVYHRDVEDKRFYFCSEEHAEWYEEAWYEEISLLLGNDKKYEKR